MVMPRIGHGLDSHALAPGRPLVLGGVRLADAPRGAVAHSDGDVLLHALADALLATAALGDIGDHFPPSDERWRGVDSRLIVASVLDLLTSHDPGCKVVNVAAVVVLDAPRLGDHRAAIARSVADLLGLAVGDVGLTFKTSEGLASDHVQASVTLLVAPGAWGGGG